MKQYAVHQRITRREFMNGAALATAAFTVLPSRVLGFAEATSPNEKLNIAGIGIGGQGGNDIQQVDSQNIVALCDVDQRHAGHTFKRYPKARIHTDFRQMLDEQQDIEAVVVGTPDHLHAFASMYAIKLGKHVYCEKPLTHSVCEARKVAQAARERKVATQMGNQGQASEETRRLCEIVWSGAIGAVREVHLWTDRPSQGLFNEYWPQGIGRPKDEPPIPDTLNWDLWLGPAPSRPYHPAYLPFKWRGWWDFGTGALGDIGCHTFDPIFRALKLGQPTSVQACSTRVNKETYPLASMVHYEFPARGDLPPVSYTWYDGGLRPPRPKELRDGPTMGDNGRLLIGDKGMLLGLRLLPVDKFRDYPPPPKTIPRSVGHYKEWIAACKGGPPGGSNFDWAGPLAEVVLLGNVALRLQLREELTRTKLDWDGPSLKFTNLPEANEFLSRQYREGWTL